jgi:hypothetical protein
MYIQTRVFNIKKEDMVFMSQLFSCGDKYEWKSLVNIYLPLHTECSYRQHMWMKLEVAAMGA